MLALGLLLNFAGIGLFCWLIFTLAVYALPFLSDSTSSCWHCTAAPASLERRLLALPPAG
jgi:hypothetical protein